MAASSSHSLGKACASLTLSEEEDGGMIIDEGDIKDAYEDYKFVLVGRLMTEKPIKFNVLKDTIAAIWRPGKGLNIKEANPNLFLFQFFHEVDINRVMEDGPWAFEQSLLVLRRLKPSESPFEVPLTQTEFWVQAHKLPAGFFTEKIAKAIGNSLGTFVRADKKNFDGTWKTFLRVRVLMDVTKPLRRKMKMKREGGDWFWIEFKYERLPNFCFLCGVLGNTERFCHKLFEGANDETERPYGPWIRATGRRPPTMVENQWLVSEAPSRSETLQTCPTEVEMVDSEPRTHVVYEDAVIRNTEEQCTGNDRGYGPGFRGKETDKHGKDKEVETMGQTNPYLDIGLLEKDQKRKRAESLNLDEGKILFTEVVSSSSFGPKNLQEAGSVSQVHLGQ